MKPTNAVVIGIGNPVLSDDAVGLRVAQELRRRLAGEPAVTVHELYTGGMSVLEAMAGHDRAVLIDAIVTGTAPPGAVHELRCDDTLFTQNMHSTHDGSLLVALDLGRAAGVRVPSMIRVWAVEAGDLSTFSEVLTPSVERAVPRAAEMIVRSLVADGVVGAAEPACCCAHGARSGSRL